MTTLKKSIKREVACYGTRPVIVELDAETKRIGFREKGCKTTYWIPIMTVFALAIRANEKGGKS